MLSYIEKGQGRISSSSVHQSRVSSGCPRSRNRVVGLCAAEGLLLTSLTESETLKAGAMPEGHRCKFKQNKGARVEPETRKDIPTQGKKPSTGCVGSLSHVKDVFQTQGLFLCG